jgi:hypothetical protein
VTTLPTTDDLSGASIHERTDDDGVYVECDECQDVACSAEHGDSLADLIDGYRRHVDAYHEKKPRGGYSDEDGARIVAEAKKHPHSRLIWAMAERTFDATNEAGDGAGGGMWWHLDLALIAVEAVVEELPALCHEAAS